MRDPQPAIRPATVQDLPAINAIYNHEIETGVATWDYDPWPLAQRQRWFDERAPDEPVLIAEVDDDVAGFGYLSWYRSKIGYRFTREDTVYVAPRHQGRGLGALLLEALIEQARTLGIRAVIAQIEASNVASVRLHERFGFEPIGRERQVGFKFERWLDAIPMQLLLPERGPIRGS